MKKFVQNLIEHLGYELRKKAPATQDAFDVMKDLVQKREPIIFDVGAHIGTVVLEYRKRFPDALIYCFEPFSESFEILKTTMLRDSRTAVYRTAISDRDGNSSLNVNTSRATNSLLSTDAKGSFYWGEGLLDTLDIHDVETTTIDNFCHKHNLPFIDILKVDVQGAEFAVLTGAKEMLSSQLISIIYTELILATTYIGQKKLHEYLGILDSLNYELFDMYNIVRRHKQLIQFDLIFVSSKFKEQYEANIEFSMKVPF